MRWDGDLQSRQCLARIRTLCDLRLHGTGPLGLVPSQLQQMVISWHHGERKLYNLLFSWWMALGDCLHSSQIMQLILCVGSIAWFHEIYIWDILWKLCNFKINACLQCSACFYFYSMLCKLSSDWLEIVYVTSKLLIEKIKVGLIFWRKKQYSGSILGL